MKSSQLGQTDINVGRLGLGTWQIGEYDIDQSTVNSIVGKLVEAGGGLIDTSRDYQNAETLIGEAIKNHSRDDITLVTKCGHAIEGIEGEDFSHEVVEQSIDASLQELQVDYVDVLLIHSCDIETLQKGEIGYALSCIKDQGKTRYIGYSGDNEALKFAVGLDVFDVFELSFNLFDIHNIDAMIEANNKDKGTIIKRPVANGCWREEGQVQPRTWEYSEEYRDRYKTMEYYDNILADDMIDKALSFVLSHPVSCAAVGTTSPDHMAQNIDILENLKPNEDDIQDISNAFFRYEENLPNYLYGETLRSQE